MVKNCKAKGSRNERKARDLLYEWGAHAVVKAGASLGVFDLLAIFPGELVCVQVKSNRWAGSKELAAIKAFPRLSYLRKLVFRYRDGSKEPDIKEIA